MMHFVKSSFTTSHILHICIETLSERCTPLIDRYCCLHSTFACAVSINVFNVNQDSIMTERPKLLRVSKVAAELDLSRTYLYKLINDGVVPVRKIGTTLRIPSWWVDEQAAKTVSEEG